MGPEDPVKPQAGPEKSDRRGTRRKGMKQNLRTLRRARDKNIFYQSCNLVHWEHSKKRDTKQGEHRERIHTMTYSLMWGQRSLNVGGVQKCKQGGRSIYTFLDIERGVAKSQAQTIMKRKQGQVGAAQESNL